MVKKPVWDKVWARCDLTFTPKPPWLPNLYHFSFIILFLGQGKDAGLGYV